MNRRIECRSEGCGGEVVFKTVEGVYPDPLDRRPGGIRNQTGRGSPNGYHRHSSIGSPMVSAYCKMHTCSHFFREEGCNNKRPPHDSVCAVHARCPVQDCINARGQYMDTKYEPKPGSVPRYMRYELCHDHKCVMRGCQRGRATSKSSFCREHGCQADGCLNPSQDQRNCCEEHQCNAEGCRTIVEGDYPFCVIHIKCDVPSCNMARHLMPQTKEYLEYCTNHSTCEVTRCREIKRDGSHFCPDHTCHERDCEGKCDPKPYCDDHACAEPNCEYPRPINGKLKNPGKFCPMHTCRDRGCLELVGTFSLYCKAHVCSRDNCLHEAMAEQLCINHFKDEYIAHGERERETKERAHRSQMFERDRRYFGTAPQRNRDAELSTDSETVTETESENERDDPKKEPPRFTDSHVSNNSKRAASESRPAAARRAWQRRASSFAPPPANTNGDAGSQTKKQQKGKQRWADDPSPRGSVGSRVGSTSDSLIAEDGESFLFTTDAGGVPGSLPGSYVNGSSGGASKPVGGGKRASSMPSDSGTTSTATARVL